MFDSVAEIAEGLKRAHYITDPTVQKHIFLAAKLHKPLLIEGPPGSGKSEIAFAIAKAANTDCLRLQCFEGIGADKAIGKFDEALQKLYLSTQEHLVEQGWETLKKALHSLDFFIPGPLLQSLLYEDKPCVLLIDELDKVDHAFEAMLLEFLSVWEISLPQLGTIPAHQIPFVVMSSNEERRLGDPLRSRSLYLRFEFPSLDVERAIIQAKCPRQNADQIAGFAKALRSWSLEKPPSIREMLDLANSMEILKLEQLTPELRDTILPVLAKTKLDIRKMVLKRGFAAIVEDGQHFTNEMQSERVSG